LALAFGVENLPPGERFPFSSGSIGSGLMPVRYNKLLNVVVSPLGFGISLVSVLGRAPSVFIPWAQVESVTKSRVMFLDSAIVRVRGKHPTISIYGAAGASLMRTYDGGHAQRTRHG
jgi:hypothetical protein